MCAICGFATCQSGCPNADEPKEIYTCEICNRPIVEGDEYIRMDDSYFHIDCYEDLDTKEKVSIAGGEVGIAKDDEYDEYIDDMYERSKDDELIDRCCGDS